MDFTSDTMYSRVVKLAWAKYFSSPHDSNNVVIDHLSKIFDWQWRRIMSMSQIITRVFDKDSIVFEDKIFVVG